MTDFVVTAREEATFAIGRRYFTFDCLDLLQLLVPSPFQLAYRQPIASVYRVDLPSMKLDTGLPKLGVR